jgi:CHASE3 domain sensor protein
MSASSNWKRPIFNDNVTIRTQILVSFSMIVVVSVGVTLAICYGLMYNAGQQAYDTASSTIISNTKQSVLSNAVDLANAINQQLVSAGTSFSNK